MAIVDFAKCTITMQTFKSFMGKVWHFTLFYLQDPNTIFYISHVSDSGLQVYSNCLFFLVPSGTKIAAILDMWSSWRFEDQQLYEIYKYVTSSNVGFVANIHINYFVTFV